MTRVRGMILAAGEGQRLRPLTERTPKALVEIAGRPLIDYAVRTLVRSGITDIIVNLHWLGEQIRAHLGDGSGHGAKVRYSAEDPLQGSGGGIARARPLLGDGTFVTLNADTIIDIDLRDVIAFHRERRATATLVLRKDPRMESYGLIRIDGEGRIGKFLEFERAGACEDLEPYMYTGVQVLEPSVFDYMRTGVPFSITQVTYPEMLAADEPLYGYAHPGTWLTVGTPAELAAAEASAAGLSLDSREPGKVS